MFRSTHWIAGLLICAALLSAMGSASFLDAAAAPLAATAPNLGTATAFGVLGASTVTNTGSSSVQGDLGVSPGTAITGFPPGIVNGTIHATDAVATQAQSDVTTAYNELASQVCDTTYPGAKDLAGEVLLPGVYCADSFGLTGNLSLAGGAADVWIFKSASTLITGSNAQINLSGGAVSCNVWWQVGSSATLGAATAFRGNILALALPDLQTVITQFVAALARTAAVTMDTNNVATCFGPNAITLGSFGATPAADFPLGVSAGVALLVLGLLVARLRGRASRDEMPARRQEASK